MAISYYQATKLYEQTLKDISKNEFTWKQFLTSSCKNYRLSFDDMVMIYAQRPDAIAVLEMEDWNKSMDYGSNQNQKELQYLIHIMTDTQDFVIILI